MNIGKKEDLKMSKVKAIGLIVEDNSDFETIRTLIKRMVKKENLCFKKAIGNGCGKLKRKALDYTVDLTRRGCDMIILVHDLDRNDYAKLLSDLKSKLQTAPIEKKFICIPIEEIEAWLLSDPKGIKKTMNLNRKPKFKGEPETISSPKEKLGEQIFACSNKTTLYLNTKHNQKIAEEISLELVNKRCSSFNSLTQYISQFKY